MNPVVARKAMLTAGTVVAVVVFTALALPMGEVITLETVQADGHTSETQLWIVERAGKAYIRGGRDARWVERVRAHPEVRVRRPGSGADLHGGGGFRSYRASEASDPAQRAAINDAMAEKYGIADRLISVLSNRDESVILQLDSIPEPAR